MGQGVRNFRSLGKQSRVLAVTQFVSTKQTTEVANGRLEYAKCQQSIDSAFASETVGQVVRT